MAPGPVEELALLDLERSNKGASKQRRDQINGEIGTMRDLLPLQESARQRLSQLQIMSLSCVYIRKCNVLQKMLPTNRCSIEVPCDFSSALTGFLLVTTRDGKLIYISENVTEYLGHSMVDMKTQGDSLFDIVDKRDHGTVQAQLLHAGPVGDGQSPRNVSFFCRMNMSRTLKRQGGFGDVKVMHVKGRFVPLSQKESGSGEQHVFMALCSPLITPDVKESLIQNNTMIYKSVHKLDMTFIEMTETAEYHLGYNNAEIQRQSWYSMVHPEDLTEARAKHIQLIKSRHEMGCMMTVRMLTKSQKVIWVNIVMHVKQALVSNSDDPVVVCINQVVSEEEAKQFKVQGQLFALYAARAPDIFFGGHNFPPMQTSMDPELMTTRPQMLLQQQSFYPEHQRLQFGGPGVQQSGFTHQPLHYGNQDQGFEILGQRPQGHTSTIKALKRKLQENFISSCKPTKMARLSSVDSQSGNGNIDFGGAADSKYVMNVNVYSHHQNGLLFRSGRSIGSFCSETVPMVYQPAQLDPVQAIRNKKALLVQTIPSVQSTCPDIQKLAPSCTQEQVVPEVAIPDCYLTPDPSPVSSPKPSTRSDVQQQQQQETHEIKHLTTFVTERLNQLKEDMSMSEGSVSKPTVEVKKKNLPVIDATFVESFFDDLGPITLNGLDRKIEIKTEPVSPCPVPIQSPRMRSSARSPRAATSPTDVTSPLPPKLAEISVETPSYDMHIKEEFTFEDCTDLEELLNMVGSAGPNQLSNQIPMTEQTTQKLPSKCLSDSYMEASPSSSYRSSHGSPVGLDPNFPEMSPGSSSPCYEGRDDLLEPDNWLLEPISMSLEMSLPELEPQEVKVEPREDELYHLKQLLQDTWAPCGVATSHKHTQ